MWIEDLEDFPDTNTLQNQTTEVTVKSRIHRQTLAITIVYSLFMLQPDTYSPVYSWIPRILLTAINDKFPHYDNNVPWRCAGDRLQ